MHYPAKHTHRTGGAGGRAVARQVYLKVHVEKQTSRKSQENSGSEGVGQRKGKE